MKALDDTVSVGGQMSVNDLKTAVDKGFKTVINNRPNGEVFGQPGHETLAAEAENLGLVYHYIPMKMLSQEAVEASMKAYADSPRPIAAFCASGTRSAVLWSFAHVKEKGTQDVLASAANAGYELEQIRRLLTEFEARN